MSDAELTTAQTLHNHFDPSVQTFINQIFSDTRIKLAENDPVVMLYVAIRQMMKNEMDEFQKSMTIFSHNLVDKTQNQLDNANEYFVGNNELYLESFEEKAKLILASMDDKNKELNFVLAKIQGEYDKQLDERFEKNYQKITQEQAQTIKKLQAMAEENLKRQRKIDTSKQRDIMIGVGGFVVGLVICLLVVFAVKFLK